MAKKDYRTVEEPVNTPAPEAEEPKRRLRDEFNDYAEETDAAIESLRLRVGKLERALTRLLADGVVAKEQEETAEAVEDIMSDTPVAKNGPGVCWYFTSDNGGSQGYTSSKREANILANAGFKVERSFVMYKDGTPERELSDEEIENLF